MIVYVWESRCKSCISRYYFWSSVAEWLNLEVYLLSSYFWGCWPIVGFKCVLFFFSIGRKSYWKGSMQWDLTDHPKSKRWLSLWCWPTREFPGQCCSNLVFSLLYAVYAQVSLLFYRPQNLIAQSQSGTGKTAAFVLAMLSRVNTLELFPQVRKGWGREGNACNANDILVMGDITAKIW